jgi:hypothetical protein
MKPNDDDIAESSGITDKEDADRTVSLSCDRKQSLNMLLGDPKRDESNTALASDN